MRLLPDSIAGRTAWLLVIGLVLTTAMTFGVSGWGQTRSMLERIATITAIVNRVPADARAALLPALREPGIDVAWTPGAAPPDMAQGLVSQHLARDVRVALERSGLTRVEAGPAAGAAGVDAADSTPTSRSMQIWIALADGTWLNIVVESERIAALLTGRVALTLIVLATGIVLLALWAARKLTLPLVHFAGAAQRLGADVNAQPMGENGPSEIRQAARAFNEMQKRIQRFVEDRTLMLAAISHDLRTALSRLKLRTEFIDDARQRDKALADLDEMAAMLDSTLSFARDDASPEATRRIDLAVLLQSLCDDLSDSGKPVRYDGAAHLTYAGRPVALRRVFTNLIDNAIEYGHEAAVTLVDGSDTIAVSVGDRGPGIPETMRERVFAPFFRLEPSRSRETGGTGLGLSVARTIARRHGGDIGLEDRPGGGLLATVVLPRAGE